MADRGRRALFAAFGRSSVWRRNSVAVSRRHSYRLGARNFGAGVKAFNFAGGGRAERGLGQG